MGKNRSNHDLNGLRRELRQLADQKKAKLLQRFFKTGKGEYGEGDIFLGITVPQQRQVAKKYASGISLADLDKLIKSKVHEERLVALLILVDKYQKFQPPRPLSRPPLLEKEGNAPQLSKDKSGASPPGKGEYPAKRGEGVGARQIYDFYLRHTQNINNWDLVDLSAPRIVGAYLHNRDKSVLYRLAKSKNPWERRIAILSTFYDIYYGQPKDSLKIARMLLSDPHDLIHKAVGWMLREAGKRCSEKILLDFLDRHYRQMPRTMLRYAIERLTAKVRLRYLKAS